jgi:hypothetical protein
VKRGFESLSLHSFIDKNLAICRVLLHSRLNA